MPLDALVQATLTEAGWGASLSGKMKRGSWRRRGQNWAGADVVAQCAKLMIVILASYIGVLV